MLLLDPIATPALCACASPGSTPPCERAAETAGRFARFLPGRGLALAPCDFRDHLDRCGSRAQAVPPSDRPTVPDALWSGDDEDDDDVTAAQ